jgi:hypothetical protein
MTAIFVLSIIILGLAWTINMFSMIVKMSNNYGIETGVYLIAMFLYTIKTTLLIVFVSILYAN